MYATLTHPSPPSRPPCRHGGTSQHAPGDIHIHRSQMQVHTYDESMAAWGSQGCRPQSPLFWAEWLFGRTGVAQNEVRLGDRQSKTVKADQSFRVANWLALACLAPFGDER